MNRISDSDRDGQQRTPLDELAEDIESKEGRRRGRGEPAGIFTVSSTGLRLLGAIAVVGLALLVTSTVLLWQIADRTGSDGSGDGSTPIAEAPPLPEEPKRGTNSKELLGEFDELTGDLSSPLRSLNGQLAGLSAFPESLASSTEVFGGLSGNLELLASQTKNVKRAQRSLEQVARSTRGLSDVQASLKKLNKEIAVFDTVSINTDVMSERIAIMVKKLDSTNSQLGALAALDARMQQMNASLEGFDSMNESLEKMSQDMALIFEVFCAYIPNPPPELCRNRE